MRRVRDPPWAARGCCAATHSLTVSPCAPCLYVGAEKITTVQEAADLIQSQLKYTAAAARAGAAGRRRGGEGLRAAGPGARALAPAGSKLCLRFLHN